MKSIELLKRYINKLAYQQISILAHWHIGTLLCILFFSACEEKMTEEEISQIGIKTCKLPAPYIKSLGLDPTKAAYSTEAHSLKGLALISFTGDAANLQQYQDSSWVKCGYMGSITVDDKGNAFTNPIPVVNTLNAPLSTINRIYKVDGNTGKMALFSILPLADTSIGVVPYGPLGIYFDCHASKIYASTVAGSTRDEEKGVIYKLNHETGKVEDELKGYDAIALCVGGVTGTKKLYFGSARTSDIYSVELNKKGDIIGKPTIELTLDQLGPRGDDKARRIRFDSKGNLIVHGVEFNFSLSAASIKPETVYTFMYYPLEEKWHLLNFH